MAAVARIRPLPDPSLINDKATIYANTSSISEHLAKDVGEDGWTTVVRRKLFVRDRIQIRAP